MVHALALLDEALDDDLEDDIIDFLARCQDKDGGYSGGPGQVAPIPKHFEPQTFELDNIFDFAICIVFYYINKICSACISLGYVQWNTEDIYVCCYNQIKSLFSSPGCNTIIFS